MGDVNVLFDRLTKTFGKPGHTKDPDAFLDEIERQIVRFSTETLDRAANALIRNADSVSRWPAPKAIVDACIAAQEATAQSVGHLPRPEKWPWELQAEQADEWARKYCDENAIGAIAAAEDWGRSLRNWAQSYARERLRQGASPDLNARPSADEIKYWKQHCREPRVAVDEALIEARTKALRTKFMHGA